MLESETFCEAMVMATMTIWAMVIGDAAILAIVVTMASIVIDSTGDFQAGVNSKTAKLGHESDNNRQYSLKQIQTPNKTVFVCQ